MNHPFKFKFVFIILAVSLALLVSCVSMAQTPTTLSVSPLTTSTVTLALPTPLETFTPEPSSSSTPIPTRHTLVFTPITPSSTPIIPTPTLVFPFTIYTPDTPSGGKSAYRLVDWTPEKADNLIALMASYPDLSEWFKPQDYNDNFEYAALAASEALLHFPEDSRVDKWRFEQADYSSYGRYGLGGEYYRKLMVDALNDGKVKPDKESLTDWFNSYPTSLKINIDELTPLPGYISSQIVNIGKESVGLETFWLLERKDGFVSYPLFKRLSGFYSTDSTQSLADFNGDGIEDIIISLGNHNGTFIGGEFVIYDLSTIPPTKLSFGPDPAWLVAVGWSKYVNTYLNQDGTQQIIVSGGPDYHNCFIDFSNTFEWNGQWFDLVGVEINFWGGQNQWRCINIFEDFNFLSPLEQQALLRFYEHQFGDWKPYGDEYSPDAQDEFRYRLALQHAMLGERNEAIDYLTRIINSPSIPNSHWIEPAQEFMNTYQATADIYRVCQNAKVVCNLQQAVKQAARSIPNANHAVGIEQLKEFGIPILSSGPINLDNDSILEHWFILRNQDNKLEFWLLAQSDQTLKAWPVTTLSGLRPKINVYSTWSLPESDYSIINSDQGITYFSLGTSDLFAFMRRQSDQEPFTALLESDSLYNEKPKWAYEQLNQSVDDLFSGVNPEQIVKRLVEIKTLPDFVSHSKDYHILGKYYYYLGLAYELSGKQQEAFEAYLQSWQNCCSQNPNWAGKINGDPFAIMAKAKLEPTP